MEQISPLYSHFDDLVNLLISNCGQHLISLLALFSLIVTKHPEIVSKRHIDDIFSSIENIPYSLQVCALIQTLGLVANYKPYLFDNHYKKLTNLVIKNQNAFIFECLRNYIISSTLINNENKANEYLNILLNLAKTKNCTNEIQNDIFFTCLIIGLKYKQLLINHRDDFTQFKSNLIINFIDNNITKQLDQTTIVRAQVEFERIEQCLNEAKKNSQTEQTNVSLNNVYFFIVTTFLHRPMIYLFGLIK